MQNAQIIFFVLLLSSGKLLPTPEEKYLSLTAITSIKLYVI